MAMQKKVSKKPAMAAKAAGRKTPAPKAKLLKDADLPKLFAGLDTLYPKAECELDFQSPFQLLIAVILSAQCTDKRVNMVTPVLFARYPTPKALAASDPEEVEEIIKSTGFFRNKTKSIRAAAAKIVDEFGGEVPRDMDKLLTVPGAARKTANVVRGVAFGLADGVVVDTHVMRLSARLGLTAVEGPEKIEQDLMKRVPKARWISFSHQLIWHGRRVCFARKPNCQGCGLNSLCPSAFAFE